MTPSPGRQARRPPHAQAVHAKLPLRVKFDTLRVPSLAGAPFNQDPTIPNPKPSILDP